MAEAPGLKCPPRRGDKVDSGLAGRQCELNPTVYSTSLIGLAWVGSTERKLAEPSYPSRVSSFHFKIKWKFLILPSTENSIKDLIRHTFPREIVWEV